MTTTLYFMRKTNTTPPLTVAEKFTPLVNPNINDDKEEC
jgi:hypothetical protein